MLAMMRVWVGGEIAALQAQAAPDADAPLLIIQCRTRWCEAVGTL